MDRTLSVLGRPGNHRFDSFLNIMQTGRIGLVFLVPNRREVERISGTAQVVRDIRNVRRVLLSLVSGFHHIGSIQTK